MNYIKTSLPGVILIEPIVFGDHRGFFMETWQEKSFRENVADISFVQDNHSKSSRGTLRGLHYQINQPQGKLVRVTSGSVFDTAVDMRKSSPTFGQWVGYKLSAENKRMLWVPPGFAHGFYVLSDNAEFTYKCTDYYAPEYERCLIWSDPSVGIHWPLIKQAPPILSEKDILGSPFSEADHFE